MFTINKQKWKIHFVSPNHPVLLTDSGYYTLGACDNNTKTVYISDVLDEEKAWKVLCHEITHAAMFSYGVSLCVEQEEVLADLVATYGYEIVDMTNTIFTKLKGE